MAIPTPTTPIYDPDLPVYAEPEIDIPTAEIEQQPVGDFIDPAQATVEGRLPGILQSGSPILERAQTISNRGYQKRGLLNSAGAVQAGTAAVLDKAIDIAAPDAQLYGQAGLQQQKASQDAILNSQAASLDMQREQGRARISGALTQQEQQGAVEIQRIQDNAQLRRVELDRQWQQLINFDQMDQADRESLLGVQRVYGESLTGGIERIMRDTNVENKTEAIDALMTQYQSNMTTAAAVVGLELNWS